MLTSGGLELMVLWQIEVYTMTATATANREWYNVLRACLGGRLEHDYAPWVPYDRIAWQATLIVDAVLKGDMRSVVFATPQIVRVLCVMAMRYSTVATDIARCLIEHPYFNGMVAMRMDLVPALLSRLTLSREHLPVSLIALLIESKPPLTCVVSLTADIRQLWVSYAHGAMRLDLVKYLTRALDVKEMRLSINASEYVPIVTMPTRDAESTMPKEAAKSTLSRSLGAEPDCVHRGNFLDAIVRGDKRTFYSLLPLIVPHTSQSQLLEVVEALSLHGRSLFMASYVTCPLWPTDHDHPTTGAMRAAVTRCGMGIALLWGDVSTVKYITSVSHMRCKADAKRHSSAFKDYVVSCESILSITTGTSTPKWINQCQRALERSTASYDSPHTVSSLLKLWA